jgi:RNA polymerase sigma-70 factor (ECF subfamily)
MKPSRLDSRSVVKNSGKDSGKSATPSSSAVRFTEKEREFVYSVAMKYMKDEEQAADVAQDALLLAYRHRNSFQGNARFTTWLYRIAATTSLMHLRKQRRTPAMLSTDADEVSLDEASITPLRPPVPTPEDKSASHEALSRAAGELDHIGEKYGRIFAMRFLEGYSESEIAEQLDLNVSTVKTRAYRARAWLRKRLEQEGRKGSSEHHGRSGRGGRSSQSSETDDDAQWTAQAA